MLLVADIGVYQGNTIGDVSEIQTLWLQDLGAELASHVCLAVLVEGHQLIHADDAQFHIHLRAVHITLQLRGHFKHIAVLGHVVGHRLAVFVLFIIINDVDRHLSLQQTVFDIAKLGRGALFLALRVGGFVSEIQFCLNLGRLVDLTVHLDTAKQHVIVSIVVGNHFADSLVQLQFIRLLTFGANEPAKCQSIN